MGLIIWSLITLSAVVDFKVACTPRDMQAEFRIQEKTICISANFYIKNKLSFSTFNTQIYTDVLT